MKQNRKGFVMKKKYIVVLAIIGLVIGCVLAYYFDSKNETIVSKIIPNVKSYEDYKSGDKVSFADEKWYVMFDSNKKSDYVSLISDRLIALENYPYVWTGSYDKSFLKEYFENELLALYGKENLVAKKGYTIRLLNKDDINALAKLKYNKDEDYYEIEDCPDFICLTNSFYATMIETNDNKEFVDVYENVNDIDDPLFEDYKLHLGYYDIYSTYDIHELRSVVDDATLFVRPIINVYKDSLDK